MWWLWKKISEITLKTPKPLIKVKIHCLDYIMKNLTRFGVNDILLCHYKFKIFRKIS